MKKRKSGSSQARADRHWMKLALTLAEKGRAAVSPNPMVGAVVVRRGRLAGKGYHAYFGGPHAEAAALRSAGKNAEGASLYVTLEPCSSWGKTPPCVPAVLKSGVREVVIAALDENPDNRGKGVRALKKAGLKVRTGVLAAEAKKQNEWFFKYMKEKRPFVTLKMAQSLDGKIATFEGRSRWITSAASRDFVHRLRREHDAVLVGKNTFLTDDPFLSPRTGTPSKSARFKKSAEWWEEPGTFGRGTSSTSKPWRLVLAGDARVSPRARVLKGPQLTIFIRDAKKLKKQKSLRGTVTLPVKSTQGQLDIGDLTGKLGRLGVAKLLVEGGGETAWSFLRAGQVDQVYWFIAPKIVGGREAKTSVEGEGIRDLNKAFRFREISVTQLGDDYLFKGRF